MSFPPIAELVPQAGAMRLLSRVLAHERGRTVCEARAEESDLFAEPGGGVPAFLALEYMAQCAAAHGGLAARARGAASAAPARGLFVGARRVRLAVDAFRPGQVLHVEARHRAGERGLLAFDCAVRDAAGGEPLVEARLNVYTLGEGAPGAERGSA